MTLLATACGGEPTGTDASPSGSTPAPTGTTAAEPTATPTEAVTVTVVTHDSFNISEEVIDAFEAESGITLELLASGDAGSMVNQAILTAGNPQGDVLFGVDNTFLSRALDAELFLPYESPELGAVDPELVLDDEHRVTPIDVGDVCLNYDREVLADDEVPTSLEELVPFADQLVVENPATSSPGLAFLLATVETFGEDGYLDFWQQLADGGVTVADGWEDAYYGQFSGGAGEGDNPLVVSYASSPPAEVYFADPRPDEAPTGVIEASCFRQIEFAGILQGTEYEAEAQQVIDWMLSPSFQEDIPLNMFVFPARTGVTLPDVFVEHATLPSDPIELDFRQIGEHREEWVEAWTSTVLR
ncbi:MAG: thiamine ABC transporter substrate-binding protein [Actinobacteria bacterium]|nr:thiamine ABC transporter substrate-binding protein [Actinomycetota bacterium]